MELPDAARRSCSGVQYLFENVCVVDSQNICTGQGYLVLKAAKWAADGLTARAIQMKLQSLSKRVELSFVLDRLDFMAKSGRCSGVLAFGANLLGIKPALEVINGELKVVKKYRGSLPICVGKYITDRLTLYFLLPSQDNSSCQDCHCACYKHSFCCAVQIITGFGYFVPFIGTVSILRRAV